MKVTYLTPWKTDRIKIVGSDGQLIWFTHKIKDAEKLIESMKRNHLTTWKSLPHNIKLQCMLTGSTGFDFPEIKGE